MNKLLKSILFIAIAIIPLSFQQGLEGRELQEDGTPHSLVCSRIGDKNRGHGNDPYIEFAMNIPQIGAAQISGDFDLDNPGASLDKQMEIVSNGQTIQWASLSDSQKQNIRDEWARQTCLLDLSLFAD